MAFKEMLSFTCLLMVLTMTQAITKSDCPKGFFFSGNKCYFATGHLSWSQSWKSCYVADSRATLVEIISKSDQNDVFKAINYFINGNKAVGCKYFWTAGHKKGPKWMWQESRAPFAFYNWAQGYPKKGQACMSVEAKNRNKWMTMDCLMKTCGMCQITKKSFALHDN